MGRPPLLSDSELVRLAVAQALLGYHSEARWLRYANKHLTGMFPHLPQRAGCNQRLRSALADRRWAPKMPPDLHFCSSGGISLWS